MTASEFKKLDFPRAEDLGAIFEYFQMDTSAYSLGTTKQLDANCMDFDSFMQVHAAKLKELLGCQSYDETPQKESTCIGFQPAK